MEREIIGCEEKGKWEEKREKKDLFLSFFYTFLSLFIYDRYQI